jgi:hypothetical protein
VEVSEGTCITSGGLFQGFGSDCTTPCVEACCLTDGSCVDLAPADCATAGGATQGLGTTCATTICPPVNDDCTSAIVIGNGTTMVDLTGATSTTNTSCATPFPAGGAANQGINNDVFYEYTATCTGMLFVDTCGDADDARLAVYDVDCAAIAGGALAIECNDDHGNATEADTGNPCAETLAASLSVPVTGGNVYIIRVGSFTTAAVAFMFPLNVDCVPAAGCGTCPGDLSGDGLVDGLDIQQFTNCYLSDFGLAPSVGCECADTIADNVIDMLDLNEMVNLLLNGSGVCP